MKKTTKTAKTPNKVKEVEEVKEEVVEPKVEEKKVLCKPGWVDNAVWGKLTDEQKQRVIDGENLGEILK